MFTTERNKYINYDHCMHTCTRKEDYVNNRIFLCRSSAGNYKRKKIINIIMINRTNKVKKTEIYRPASSASPPHLIPLSCLQVCKFLYIYLGKIEVENRPHKRGKTVAGNEMEFLKTMMMSWIWGVIVWMFCGFMSVKWVLKRVNWWLYEKKLGEKQYSLPPGDMGWPLIGNMWSFLRAFKSSSPDSFLDSYVQRYEYDLLSFSLYHRVSVCMMKLI